VEAYSVFAAIPLKYPRPHIDAPNFPLREAPA
jgi:hypothetical protein